MTSPVVPTGHRLRRDEVAYHPYYCEENIWHLARHEAFAGLDCQVVLTSNAERSCAHWEQQSAEIGEPVLWDYHVILLSPGPVWLAWDLGTRLPFSCPAETYLRATFPLADRLPERWQPRFRMMPAGDYVAQLSTDRSHMLDGDGSYIHPPPPWPAMGQQAAGASLSTLTDMSLETPGKVLDLEGLRAFVAQI